MSKLEYNRAYYAKNSARIKERQRSWYQANKETVLARQRTPEVRRRQNELRQNPERKARIAQKAKARWPVVKYGMTDLDIIDMLWEQGNKCASCGTDTPGGSKGWHVDHCHVANKVRGILCMRCNLVLGHVKDDPVILSGLITYLNTTLDKQLEWA